MERGGSGPEGLGWRRRRRLKQAAFSGRAVPDPAEAAFVAAYAREQADKSVGPLAWAWVLGSLFAAVAGAAFLAHRDYGLAALWALVLVLDLGSLVRLRGRQRRLLEAVEKNEPRRVSAGGR